MRKAIKRADDEVIFARLNRISREKTVSLTYTHKVFCIRLIDLTMKEGEPCREGYKICKTEREFSNLLNISARMVTQSIEKLYNCGVIMRIDGKKTFPRSPSITILKESIYIVEEKEV